MAGNLVALALYSLMPSLLKWNYLPGIAEDKLPVEQASACFPATWSFTTASQPPHLLRH